MISPDEEKRKNQLANLKPFKEGDPRINRAGRKPGAKNWSVIVQNILGDEELLEKMLAKTKKPEFWEALPTKNAASAIVAVMVINAIKGDKSSAEWLRKTGFGDKIDLTSQDERISIAPIVISEIKPRNVTAETETDTSNTDNQQPT